MILVFEVNYYNLIDLSDQWTVQNDSWYSDFPHNNDLFC